VFWLAGMKTRSLQPELAEHPTRQASVPLHTKHRSHRVPMKVLEREYKGQGQIPLFLQVFAVLHKLASFGSHTATAVPAQVRSPPRFLHTIELVKKLRKEWLR